MKKIIEDLPKISCEHRTFSVYPQDAYTEPSNPAILIHKCNELTVLQDFRGIRRYFLKNREPSIPEPPSEPDPFLAGLVGEDEPDRAQEFNEIAMGAGDGETEIPF